MGNVYKVRVWFHIVFDIKPKFSDEVAENTIVSLTSYGRRVSRSVAYSIFSMLLQSIRPEIVILWLDYDNWSEENIPFALKRMQKWDIFEIKFCEDIRSFKKLVPALELYPDKAIITIDDDHYYTSKVVENLYNSYKKNPINIYTNQARCVAWHQDGSLASYDLWEVVNESTKDIGNCEIQLIGFGGVLYPPNSLYGDVTNKDIFMKLSPSADDLWFNTMAKLKGTSVVCVYNSAIKFFPTNLVYQKFKQESLCYSNVDKGGNNQQLLNIYKYYSLK